MLYKDACVDGWVFPCPIGLSCAILRKIEQGKGACEAIERGAGDVRDGRKIFRQR